jgi:hypothetical protein
LRYNVPSRANQRTVREDVETFELRSGPSDVTSYHDFASLHIAFEHVWTEIFDGQLAGVGRELYHEYVKLKDYAGVDEDDRRIETIDDLRRLMDDVRALSQFTNEATPAAVRPTGSTGSTPTTSTAVDAVDVVTTVLDPIGVVTDLIPDPTVRALLNPGGAIIDAFVGLFAGKPKLTWSSFPGPLPGGDIIRTTFEANAVPAGTVEIVLKTLPATSSWKGMHFREYDTTQRVVSEFRISNDPNDPWNWNRASYNVLPLYTGQLPMGVLEFGKEGAFGVHTGFYLLLGLDQRMPDRTRVTFTWERH